MGRGESASFSFFFFFFKWDEIHITYDSPFPSAQFGGVSHIRDVVKAAPLFSPRSHHPKGDTSPRAVTPIPAPPQSLRTLTTSRCLDAPILHISHKWQHTLRDLLCPTSLAKHRVSKVIPSVHESESASFP